MYPVPPARETQGLTDKYIATWLKDQKRQDIVLATKVWAVADVLQALRSQEWVWIEPVNPVPKAAVVAADVPAAQLCAVNAQYAKRKTRNAPAMYLTGRGLCGNASHAAGGRVRHAQHLPAQS
jgi:hypothetical protein